MGVSAVPDHSKNAQAYRAFWLAVAVVVVIKAVLLLLDHAPNFFMGDSAAFVGTALTKWFPPQRSWTYGFFIRWTCLPALSLLPLLIAQTLGGIVTCALLGFCLLRFFRISPGAMVVAMIACALDPMQLLYERMVMAEAFTMPLLALLVTGMLAYCERPRWPLLILLQVVYVGLISLRMQFLLPVGLLLVLVPVVGNARGDWRSWPWFRKVLGHLLVGAASMVVLHGAYCAAMGIKHQHRSAYSYGTSGMALTSLAPLLQPDDAPSEPLAAAIRNDSAMPLHDRLRRNDQMWEPSGLIHRIEKVAGDFYQADAAERAILRHLVRRDPVGVFRFGLGSYAGYWDFAAMPEALRLDRDAGPFDEEFTEAMARYFNLDVSGYPKPALSKTWHGWSAPWQVMWLVSPVLLFLAALRAGWEKWREMSLLFFITTVMLAQNTMLSVITSYRYLHPLAFPALLAVGILLNRRRNSQKHDTNP